ncbi:MAG: glutaminase [Thermomicrobiales bacterium]
MTPQRDPISRALDDLHRKFIPERSGTLPDYIPEPAKADPDMFGISLVSVVGHCYSAGDTRREFTMQSISKPFVYALALEDIGLEAVLERVGAEPSGRAFNAISLEKGTGRRANPMVNAGVILATSLVQAETDADRFERIRETISAFAGRPLDMDVAVYRSEWDAGDRNRALAYLMKSAGALRADVDTTVDVYFRQCALLVTTDDLAMMAATLAHGGVHPRTGRRVISEL